MGTCDHDLSKGNKITFVFALHEKCPYSEFFWPVFFRIWTEYSPYSVRMRENTDQKNSEYGHFSRSVVFRHSI